jgi:DNA primase
MNMDLDKKKEVTAVDAGIILSGQEMPTADIALFSRLVFLQLPRSTFTQEEKREYKEEKEEDSSR